MIFRTVKDKNYMIDLTNYNLSRYCLGEILGENLGEKLSKKWWKIPFFIFARPNKTFINQGFYIDFNMLILIESSTLKRAECLN